MRVGRGEPGLVGHRMAGFDHFDPPQGPAITVARDRDPADPLGRELELVEVMALRRLGHAARGLARGEHDDAPALRSRRQGGRQALVRVRGRDRGLKQAVEKIARGLGIHAGRDIDQSAIRGTSLQPPFGGPKSKGPGIDEEHVMDDRTRTELEAAVYRRLVEHLRGRTDVQNIDLMNLAGFCRNCLSNWMKDAADAKGVAMTKEESREIVYGMPYDEWRKRYQREASAEQKAAFEKSHPDHHH